MIGVQKHLDVTICKDAADAVAKGHEYHTGFTAVQVEKAVVVLNGMESGDATVDFVMNNGAGKRFVFMIPAKVLRALVAVTDV